MALHRGEGGRRGGEKEEGRGTRRRTREKQRHGTENMFVLTARPQASAFATI